MEYLKIEVMKLTSNATCDNMREGLLIIILMKPYIESTMVPTIQLICWSEQFGKWTNDAHDKIIKEKIIVSLDLGIYVTKNGFFEN